ncbi:MAG TPA: hypothetical protein VFV01_47835 [Spirillospora sp.]|nr:hypothetical protein [Spirillospora sp.]
MTAAKSAQPAHPDRDPRWDALMAPFPADQVEKLPKLLNKDDKRKGRCREGTQEGRAVSADGYYCGGWHARSVHLDYVGHAGITMRLNEAVGPENWTWEPLAYDDRGLPGTVGGEFWIKLTILGVTKLGVGDDFHGSMKQAIGDALRNAAMRFGIGTYLWSKSDAAHNLAANAEEPPQQQSQQQAPPPQQAAEQIAPAGGGTAQELANSAARVRSLNSLKALHDTAEANHLLGVEIEVPGQDGFQQPLGAYIMRRKEDIGQEPAA